MAARINFAQIAQAALSAITTLLPEWLPGGRSEAGEYKALNPTRADSKVGSFSVNLSTGRWGDFATGDAGGDLTSLYAYLNNLDQGTAARELAERLSIAERAQPIVGGEAKAKSEWVPIVPVPADAPAPGAMNHVHYGAPVGVWEYRDGEGRLLGFIRRYNDTHGGKQIVPLTWCRNAEGQRKWHAVAFPTPRPLYGLDHLAEHPRLPVLIVEGEKCADAARSQLEGRFVVITWPGGAKAVKKADWSPLAGRMVIIWPDCDAQLDTQGTMKPAAEQPGIKAAEQIATILLSGEHRAAQVRVVEIPAPGEKPSGWDVADAIAVDGWGLNELLEQLRRQRPPVAGISTPDSARASTPEPDPDWRRILVVNGHGLMKDCRENVIYLLRDHPVWRGVLGADTFAKRIVVRRESPLGHAPGSEWTANDDIALGLWLQEQERLLIRSPDTISAGVRYAAKLAPFHPLREWLESLEWDGQPRVDVWAPKYLGAVDSPYHRKVGTYFLINMIRRVFEPGCVMRSVPVLEGPQDKGKSRSLYTLAHPWFSDTTFKVGDKDSFQQIQGIWVYEISELESFTRAEATAVKAFVSSTEDNFRAPYERQNERHLRQTAFAATTNATEYLKDWTGNTRFWPLACGERIDLAGIADAREQLLAEAITRYRLGERAFPTPEEQALLFGPEQDRRMMSHPWSELVVEYLNPAGGRKDEVTVRELLIECLGLKPEKMNPQGGEAQRVGQILHALEWRKVRGSDTRRTWKWQRPAAQTEEPDHGDIPF